MPRVEINLTALTHNAKVLSERYRSRGLELAAVTKGVCGDPRVARALMEGGLSTLADARIRNIERMVEAGIEGPFMLIRPPALCNTERVVRLAAMSINTEIATIESLSRQAERLGMRHGIVLMVEMGERREGILPRNLPHHVEKVLALTGVELRGLAANWACLTSVMPTPDRMRRFSDICRQIGNRFDLHLEIVSGGNSANHNWAMGCENPGPVNHFRLGEALLLGRETSQGEAIEGLETQAFTLVAHIIESKQKSSRQAAETERGQSGLPKPSNPPSSRRIIVALGEQDVPAKSVRPRARALIVGACGDQMVLTTRDPKLGVGSELRFDLTYRGLVGAMTSPYVTKKYVHTHAVQWRTRQSPAEIPAGHHLASEYSRRPSRDWTPLSL